MSSNSSGTSSGSSVQASEGTGVLQKNESIVYNDLQGGAVSLTNKVSQKSTGSTGKGNHTCPLGLQLLSPSTPTSTMEDMNAFMTTPTASGHSSSFKDKTRDANSSSSGSGSVPPGDNNLQKMIPTVDHNNLAPNMGFPIEALQQPKDEANTTGTVNVAPPPYLLHSDTPPTLGYSSSSYQRSIPVHRHPSNSAFTITSSTRSVKSIGSSIVDTDVDDSKSMNSYLSILKDVPEVDVFPPTRDRGIDTEDAHSFSGLVVQTEQPPNAATGTIASNTTTTGPPSSDLGILSTDSSAHHIMSSLSNIQSSLGIALSQIQSENRAHHEKIKNLIQTESKQRMTLESRLHSQLLLQSEAMIAMEMKVMRLETKVERKEALLHRRKASGLGNPSILNPTVSHTSPMTFAPVGNLDVPSISGIGTRLTIPSMNGPAQTLTIDEENDFEAMEIQVTSRGRRGLMDRETRGVLRGREPTNIAVVSSGASLASGVTATSFLDGDGVEDQTPHGVSRDDDVGVDGDASARSGDGDVEDEGDGDDGVDVELDDGSNSSKSKSSLNGLKSIHIVAHYLLRLLLAPTQGSRRHFTNLESILLNPLQNINPAETNLSTRAVRGDYDGASSLATSVTNATVGSTVVTATTRGGDSINPRSIIAPISDNASGSVQLEEQDADNNSHRDSYVSSVNVNAQRGEDIDSMLGLSPPAAGTRPPRSRSHSPLTVQSANTASVGPQSVASMSVGTSVISTAAVAPTKSFRARREAAARMVLGESGRPLANRVVSFTSNEVFNVPPEISEAGDSITMPDELDNLSDVADIFADRARTWRDDYEARLDSIQKRWSGES